MPKNLEPSLDEYIKWLEFFLDDPGANRWPTRLTSGIRALLADCARMAAELEQAAELIDRLAFDDDACEIDHNGYCQTHNLHSEPCPHPLGRRFVEAWRTVQGEATERPDRKGVEKGPESHGDGRSAYGAPLALSKPEEALPGAPGADGLCDSRLHRDFAEDQDIRCQLPAGHAAHRNGTQEWTP